VNRASADDTRLLLTVGWLSQCEPAFGEAVFARGRIQVLAADEPLFHPGDPSTGLYGVLSGAVAVSFSVPEFGPSISHILQPGAWFGETAYVRKPHIIGVRATRATRAVFLAARDIESLVAHEPLRWTDFAQLALLNAQLAMGAAYDLMLRDPLHRCAATLLRLAGLRHGPPLAAAQPVELDITQVDLAYMTNLSRNSVGAILRVLREKQCVDVDYRQLLVTDVEGLKALLSAER